MGTNIRINVKQSDIQRESKKNPPWGLVAIFPKRLGIFNQIWHAYYAFLSTLDYEFLLN